MLFFFHTFLGLTAVFLQHKKQSKSSERSVLKYKFQFSISGVFAGIETATSGHTVLRFNQLR